MKKMNQRKRGEVCGTPERYKSPPVSNRGAAYWAMRTGVRRLVVGGSLELLNAKLKMINEKWGLT